MCPKIFEKLKLAMWSFSDDFLREPPQDNLHLETGVTFFSGERERLNIKKSPLAELPSRMITASVHETTNNPSFILSEVSLKNCSGPTKTYCKTKMYMNM